MSKKYWLCKRGQVYYSFDSETGRRESLHTGDKGEAARILHARNDATRQSGNCELYRNNGDGTFTECAALFGIEKAGYVKGVSVADYNNDGWPDLYLSQRVNKNLLYRNDGPAVPDRSPKAAWKFTEVSVAAGVEDPLYSFPTFFFDYDNDGWPDLYVGGYRIRDVGEVAADYMGMRNNGERTRVYHNNRDGTFQDVTKEVGMYRVIPAMSANFGDLDNDGFLDMYLGTGDPDLASLVPNRMFRNDGGRRFQDVTTAGGFGHLQKGHGIAFADLDNDGDQDIYAVMGGAFEGDAYRNVLFENPGSSNRWVTLKLEGVKSNRSAIGARIKVVVRTEQGLRDICRTVCSGGSFGASPLRQEIGLGQASRIEQVEIFWPASKIRQRFDGLEMNRFYKIREGDEKAVVWDLKPAVFQTGANHGHHAP